MEQASDSPVEKVEVSPEEEALRAQQVQQEADLQVQSAQGEPAVTPSEDDVTEEAVNPADDMGLGDVLLEAAQQIPAGIAAAAGNIGELVGDIGAGAGELVGEVVHGEIEPTQEDPTDKASFKDSYDERINELFGKPDSVTGNLTRGIVQFFVPFSKVNGALKGVQSMGLVSRSFVAGGAVDFAAFNGYEGRLADLSAKHFPEFAPELMGFMKTDPNDTWALARVKNVIEGGLAGITAEGAGKVLGLAFRASMNQVRKINAALDAGDAADAARNAAKLELINAEAAKISAKEEMQQAQVQVFLEAAGDKVAKADVDPVVTAARADLPADAAETVSKFGNNPQDTIMLQNRIMEMKAGTRAGDDVLESYPMNIAHMKSPDEVLLMMDQVAKEFGGFDHQPTTFRAVYSLAMEMAMKPDELLQNLARLSKDAPDIASTIVAAKAVTQRMYTEVTELGRAYDGSAASAVALRHAIAISMQTSSQLKDVISGSALATAAGNIDVGVLGTAGTRKLDDMLRDFNDWGTPAEFDAFAKRIGKLNVAPSRVSGILEKVGARKAWNIANEVWINAILSGPHTHAINLTSNTVQAGVLLPLEEGFGALARGDFGGARDAMSLYGGMRRALADSYRMTRTAWRSGENTLDAGNNTFDTKQTDAVTAENFGLNPEGAAGKTVDGAGSLLRLPGRALQAEDEFFKQMNYRAKIYQSAYRDASDLKLSKDKRPDGQPSEFEAFITQREHNAFDHTGQASNAEALAYSREATFTTGLLRGSIVEMAQRAVNTVPPLRQILPFIRTPTNIIVGSMQRLPGVGMLTKTWKADAASLDAATRSRAMGRQLTAAGVAGGAMMMAHDGRITGGGPSDHETRRQWKEAGWQPYSLKVGDTWYSYEKIEPIGGALALYGNIAEMMNELSEKDYDEAAQGTVMAYMGDMGDALLEGGVWDVGLETLKQTTERSYLKSLGDIIAILSEGGEGNRGMKFLLQRVGQMVPYSSAMRQTSTDDLHREVSTFVQALQSNISWLNTNVPPKYDFMGRPMKKIPTYMERAINPVDTSQPSTDPLALAMKTYGSKPVSDKLGPIDLKNFQNREGKDAHHRYNELIGSSKLPFPLAADDVTMEGALRALVTSDRWEQLADDQHVTDASPSDGVTRSKRAAVQKVVQRYRKYAAQKLVKESFTNPDTLTTLSGANKAVSWRRSNSNNPNAQELLDVFKID